MALTVEAPVLIPLLIGLWMEADDAGSFEWKPLSLKARILPAVAAPVDSMMAELVSRGFIRRFDFAGRPYGVVRNFVKFQRPKAPRDVHPYSSESREFAGFQPNGGRPTASTGRKSFADSSELDDDEDASVPNEFGTRSEAVRNSFGSSSGISAQMEDGGGREGVEEPPVGPPLQFDAVADAPADPPVRQSSSPKKGTRLPADWAPTDADMTFAIKEGFGDDEIESLRDEFRDYWAGIPGQRGCNLDWSATWRNNIRRASERRSRQTVRTGSAGNRHEPPSFAEAAMRAAARRA